MHLTLLYGDTIYRNKVMLKKTQEMQRSIEREKREKLTVDQSID